MSNPISLVCYSDFNEAFNRHSVYHGRNLLQVFALSLGPSSVLEDQNPGQGTRPPHL